MTSLEQIDWDELPEQLVGPVGDWQEKLGIYYSELLRCAGDTAGHLDVAIGGYLDMSTADLRKNTQMCTDWKDYLANLWQEVDTAWQGLQGQDGVPETAYDYTRDYGWINTSADNVLGGLSCFFDSVLADTESIEGRKRKALDDVADNTGPNTAPLPNPWTAVAQLFPRDDLVGDALLTDYGQPHFWRGLSLQHMTAFKQLTQ